MMKKIFFAFSICWALLSYHDELLRCVWDDGFNEFNLFISTFPQKTFFEN